MGHMANGAMGPMGLWAMGPMGPWVIGTFLPIASLLLDGFLQKFYWTDINVFYLNTGQFFTMAPFKAYFDRIFNLLSATFLLPHRPHYIFVQSAHARIVRDTEIFG